LLANWGEAEHSMAVDLRRRFGRLRWRAPEPPRSAAAVSDSCSRGARLPVCFWPVVGWARAQYVDLSKLHKNSLKRYLTHFGIEARGNTKVELYVGGTNGDGGISVGERGGGEGCVRAHRREAAAVRCSSPRGDTRRFCHASMLTSATCFAPLFLTVLFLMDADDVVWCTTLLPMDAGRYPSRLCNCARVG